MLVHLARGELAGSSRCCVTSRGKLCWSTGLFDAGSAMLQAFTKSWIRLDSLSQPMLRRESSRPASGSYLHELESAEKKKQEREPSTGALF